MNVTKIMRNKDIVAIIDIVCRNKENHHKINLISRKMEEIRLKMVPSFFLH